MQKINPSEIIIQKISNQQANYLQTSQVSKIQTTLVPKENKNNPY